MKKILSLFFLSHLFFNFVNAQNSYPPSGDVKVSNYSPSVILQRNTSIGGFTQGIQTRFEDGTNNWFFGNLHESSWIVSKGDYQNPKLSVLANGNVGIGTTNPSNIQNWSRVLDVSGTNHSKILATSSNSTFRVGIFSHNEEWHGGGGFVGTESNHTLFLIAGYDPKVTILTNGNVGIGTKSPDEKLTVKGKIHAQEVRVDMLGSLVPDYVFAPDYKLKTLQEVENYIKENNHLPEIPSAAELEKNGLLLAEMNMSLLKKMEEMTLYMIEQNKRIEKLELEKK